MSQMPPREELDARLARTSHLGTHTKGASSGAEVKRVTQPSNGQAQDADPPQREFPAERNVAHPERTPMRAVAPTFMKASELMARELPELKWAVPGIQPAGLTILAGRPKLGKTSLICELGIASAAGGRALGRIKVEPRHVMLALLEDTERRIQSRLELQLEGAACPDRLGYATTWPRLDQGGLEWAEAFGKKHRGGVLWFDTWARIKPAASRNGTLYQDDYSGIASLQNIAGRYELAIGIAHHTRKMASDDPLETISGTQGLAGAADTILVLKRERAKRDAVLFVTGRDVEEAEVAVRFDAGRCRWSMLGDELSEERLAVINLLRHYDRPLSLKEVVLGLGRAPDSTKVLLWRMVNAGQLLSDGKAGYMCNPRTPVTAVTDSGSDELTVSPVTAISRVSLVTGVTGVTGFQQEPADDLDAAQLDDLYADALEEVPIG